jgi:transcriptional regulator with XRE-family HTH domain
MSVCGGHVPTDPRPEWVLARRQQIGHHIARLRAGRGLTVDALAEASRLDRKTVMRAEHGTRSVGVDVLLLLAHGLGVPPGALLDMTDPAADPGEGDGGA